MVSHAMMAWIGSAWNGVTWNGLAWNGRCGGPGDPKTPRAAARSVGLSKGAVRPDQADAVIASTALCACSRRDEEIGAEPAVSEAACWPSSLTT